MDLPIIYNWTSSFPVLGLSGMCFFYSNFYGIFWRNSWTRTRTRYPILWHLIGVGTVYLYTCIDMSHKSMLSLYKLILLPLGAIEAQLFCLGWHCRLVQHFLCDIKQPFPWIESIIIWTKYSRVRTCLKST